jgi:hypothetical protein
MTESKTHDELRPIFRQITLSVLGVVQLYEIHPCATKNLALALGDIFRASLPDLVLPALPRGRAALQQLLALLTPTTAVTGASGPEAPAPPTS